MGEKAARERAEWEKRREAGALATAPDEGLDKAKFLGPTASAAAREEAGEDSYTGAEQRARAEAKIRSEMAKTVGPFLSPRTNRHSNPPPPHPCHTPS